MTNSSPYDGEPGAPRPVAEPDHGVPLVQGGRYPVLDAAQLEVLRGYGTEQEVAAGEVLFAEGDATYDLIVVLYGEVQIVGNAGRPAEAVIATYGPGRFLGEMGLLTGQRVFADAVAPTAGRVLRVLSLAATGHVLDLSAPISMLMLRSIVVTNAIVLRDLDKMAIWSHCRDERALAGWAGRTVMMDHRHEGTAQGDGRRARLVVLQARSRTAA